MWLQAVELKIRQNQSDSAMRFSLWVTDHRILETPPLKGSFGPKCAKRKHLVSSRSWATQKRAEGAQQSSRARRALKRAAAPQWHGPFPPAASKGRASDWESPRALAPWPAPDIPDSQKVANRAQVVEKKSVSNVCSWRSPGAPFLAEELMLNLGHPPYIRLSNTQTLCPKKCPAEFRRSEAPGWRRPRRLSTASHPA